MEYPPCVILLTGLSGSGKTTIALALKKQLDSLELMSELLDGDEIRKRIRLTAFDEASRKEHNLNAGRMAATLEAEGKIVILALIAPYADVRDAIRKMSSRFFEVYVSTDISVCIRRDPKGLYQKALNGEITDFTGISAPYYPPSDPELSLDTDQLTVEDCVNTIMHSISL